jgi:hypothetical protein
VGLALSPLKARQAELHFLDGFENLHRAVAG